MKDASDVMRWRPVKQFALVYTVEQATWLGQFRPDQCRGLIDYLDEYAFVVSYLPIGEIPVERDNSWKAIDDSKDVVLSVRGTVVTTTRIQILDESSGETCGVSFEFIGPGKPEPDGNK